MPIPLFIGLLAGVLAVAVGVAIAFWPNVLQWAEEALLPWVERRIPVLNSIARSAFVLLDKVASSARRTVKNAWRQLCDYLLKTVVEIHRKSSNQYVRRVTSWLITQFQAQQQATKVVMEEVVDFDDLPSEVREALIRNGDATVDVRDLRTREINELVMTG
ncbi:hypothetical protein [Melittangium boletus]|uniref:Uncharacterized protein n=1 Tax=Melittangium boletus DSM 14713 TaxID=1294270 RepID=A0A250ILP9_9BACT|nr:hypothetical protein [Melittangium boletus]ATB32111.1 hypothetical protein MEBOL_005587 [Melittangium boletus DSM 14713]